MKKNKIIGMLVCVFALLLASFALAEVEVTGPADGKIVVDVDYSGLNDDSEDFLEDPTKTLTFTNTGSCENTCEAECPDGGETCTAGFCYEVCTGDPETCETVCEAECPDGETCTAGFCYDCCDEPETVSLSVSDSNPNDQYKLALWDPDTGESGDWVTGMEFDVSVNEPKTIKLKVTVPISEDSGPHDVAETGLSLDIEGADLTAVDIETEVESMLNLDNLKVYVDGSREDTIDESGEKTSDVAPGSEVEFRFKVENLFDNDYDEGDLDDVILSMEFADNDAEDDFGDEVEEEEEFDLDADEETEVVFDFKVPGKAEEDTYELLVKLEGKDENGAKHSVEWSVFLDVDREKDDVRLEKAYLQSDTMLCGGETFLKVKITNYGSNDQDDVALTITNEALGINVNVMDIELDEDPDDDDNSYSKTVPVSVSEDFAAGTYTIDVRAYVDGDEEVDHRLVQLTVMECAGEEVVEEVEEEEEESEEVIVQAFPDEEPTSGEEATSGMTGATVVETVETSQSRGMTAFMVVVVVLLVVLIALMLGVLLKK